MSIAAFGDQAQIFARSLPPQTPAVVADGSSAEGAALALATAAERRKHGEAFFTAVLLDEPRAIVAARIAPAILAQFPDIDARRSVFDQLAANSLSINNQPQNAIAAYEPRIVETLRDLVAMGDALLCRSGRERERVARVLARVRPFAASFPGAGAALEGPRAAGTDIVVWAPGMPAAWLAVFAFALEELRMPGVIVCADAAPLPVRSQIVGPQQAAGALARAALVVDASFSSPGAAIALARAGHKVAASSTSGADEFLAGTALYDPWDWRSIFRAMLAALGAPPPVLRPFDASALASALRAAEPPRLDDEPAVTIIVPTLNRPQTLAVALESLERQRYTNLEIIVINDGGEPVDEIVARFPRARLIDRGKIGMVGVNNIGIAEARGEFVGFLADDDIYYPDQVPRLAYALQTTGADAAHSNNIIRFVERESEGVYAPVGFKIVWDRPVDPTEMMTASSVAGHSFMYRRDAFARNGNVKDGIDAQNDYEFHLRWSLAGDFIHVDFVTNEWIYRQDPEQYNVSQAPNMARDLEIVYEMYPTSRMAVSDQRRNHLAMLKAHVPGQQFWTPAIRLTPEQRSGLPPFILRPATAARP